MERRERSRAQAAAMIWATAGAAILLLGACSCSWRRRLGRPGGRRIRVRARQRQGRLRRRRRRLPVRAAREEDAQPRHPGRPEGRRPGRRDPGDRAARGDPPRRRLGAASTRTGKPAKPGAYSFRVRQPGSGKAVSMKRVRGKRTFKVRSSRFPGTRSAQLWQRPGPLRRRAQRPQPPGPGRLRLVRHPPRQPRAGPGGRSRLPVLGRQLRRRRGSRPPARTRCSCTSRSPSGRRVGTPVSPGQQIGRVGETGNAQGLPPPLRALDRARLVQRRRALQPDRRAQGLGVGPSAGSAPGPHAALRLDALPALDLAALLRLAGSEHGARLQRDPLVHDARLRQDL